jgi:formylglycine-generating enzyme required for sulfatase activity
MTQLAAVKFCEWLSAMTGNFYRLPTEAEWEYACRAGSSDAFSFGEDLEVLDDYAWYANNSNDKYHLVGTKKPNAWGLYDMHGNVAEWTLDQYLPTAYRQRKGEVLNPFQQPTKIYPKVVRGGSWMDSPKRLRSASRRPSSKKWKMRDPQIPKSEWWHTDAPFVGLRVVRPYKTPVEAEQKKYWNYELTQ